VAKGVFSVEQTFDSKFILVPLSFTQELLGKENQYTSIELDLDTTANADDAVLALQAKLGANYTIRTRAQQNESLFKVLKSEKFYGFLIIIFIFLLAILNVAASIIMLVIEKKNDINTFRNMGANTQQIKQIFFTEGFLILGLGLILGLTLGIGVCWLQSTFHIIRLEGSGTFVVDAYPVILHITDLAILSGTILLLGSAAVWATVQLMFSRLALK
jgi:lipoprotein-releasing system permease protein